MALSKSSSAESENLPTLDRFLEDLHQELCQFKVSSEVVTDLQHAVEKLVGKIVQKISQPTAFPVFCGSKIIPRGSFYEGTKVKLPNEFDFLVELDILSRDGAVEFREECLENPGTTHVLLLDPKLHDTVTKLKQKDCRYLLPDTISHWYRLCVKKAYQSLYPDSLNHVDRIRVESGCGFLTLIQDVSNVRPNTMLSLQWTTTTLPNGHPLFTFPLTVDVTPAIVYHNPSPIGNQDNKENRKCHVIPALIDCCTYGNNFDTHCWRIAFSSDESAKMEALSEIHKKMYKILKCVCVDRRRSLRSLNSYMLKTALLHHADACDDKGSIGTCILKILDELSGYVETGHLPGYFFQKKNVWARSMKRKVVTPKVILKRLTETFEDIASHSLADYDSYPFFRKFRLLKEEFEETEMDLFR